MTDSNPDDPSVPVSGEFMERQNVSHVELRFPLLLLFCLLLAFGAGSYFIFEKQSRTETEIIEQNLATIAQLKADLIHQWLTQSRINVEGRAKNSQIADHTDRWIKQGKQSDTEAKWVASRMEIMCKRYSFVGVTLLDKVGKPLGIVHTDLPEKSFDSKLIRHAIGLNQTVMGELRWSTLPDGSLEASLPMISPLIPANSGDTIIGVAWIELNVDKYLFPLLRRWPTSSKTAETPLFVRDGNDAVMMNEPVNLHGTAMPRRISLDNKDMLVMQAAQGKLGILAGSDYRGASAIGYSLKIPDTDWFMISKIDIDEVYAPVRQRAYIAAVLAFLLLSVTSLSLFFWWRKRAAQYQAAQLQYELTQQFLSRQNEYLSKHANDIILLMDKSGNIMEANDRAEEAYGLPRASLIGKSLPELRIPVERDAFKPLWRKIRQNRSLMFESAHLRFDGTEFPVEVSARMIERGTEQFVQYIIRDITERKAALAREHRLLDMYRALGATNEAIIHLQAESDLFPLVCRIAVEHGGMVLAWIGVAEEGGRFIPVASNGRPEGYLDDLASLTSPDAAEGKSIAETACRENRSAVANDIGREESTLPWRETNRKYGIQSMAAFPIMRSGRSCAVLMVYSDHVNAFDAEIVQLLERIKASISFALDNFDKETERRQSEEALKLAAMVYRDSNEAMMILDVESRIIAVNPAFERITCYKAGDVLGESPDILRSERQGGHTYESMWEDIGMTGHWKGELWCRTRIGDDFAVMLSINTTYAPDGSPQQRLVLFSDITKKKESDELIWSQANFDALTGLPNRRLFRDQLGREVKKTRRTGLPLAVMFLDLDGFKDVNDTLGHDMGDILLKGAADRLNGCVREIDAVARLGGDEFTVILSELHDPGDVDRVARHILQELSEPFQLGDELAHVSASIGITFYPEDATEIEDLLKNADQAMYAAKQRGRNQYQYFTASMQETAQAKMRLVNDLRVALEGNQFELVYQPIVELASGAIHKAEALIRWQHPTRGSINPAEFIPAAEDTGMINAFGDWVFHEAAKQAAIWRGKYRPDFQISVNISPVQFRNEGIDSTVWFDHLERLGLPAQGIVVEITEGLLLEASENVTRQLLAFRDAGIEVALDDFGIGYSSLSYLKKFDIDYLKIDQSFIRNLAKESDDMALCEAIIVMAHKLGLKVVAEGVETERQRDLLVDAGCDYMQGYLFSEPLSALEIEKLLGVNTFAI